jgi:RNA polymerase sigma-70 factor (ECF subfamily)
MGEAARSVHTTLGVVLASGSGLAKAAAACSFARLIRPGFAFICQRHPVPPQDLPDFFVMVLKGHLLERADPDRGRFRSLLLKALKDFLANDRIKHRTLKRGGDAQFVSWDEWMAEVPSRLSISVKEAETWPAERIFDVRWAATTAEHALQQLGEECEARGRRRVFDVLSDCLAAERQDVSYQKFSKTGFRSVG